MAPIVRHSNFGMSMTFFVVFALNLWHCCASADSSKDIIAALASETNDAKRLRLVEQLAALKNPKAIATLSVELANDKNPDAIRLEALKGLIVLDHDDSRDAIAIAALKAEPARIRARAIEAIGTLRLSEFIPACVRGLKHAEPIVRRAAIDALIQFNDMRLAARSLPFVNDRAESVRKSAHIGIGLFAVKLSLFVLHLGC